jgi:hypothetical protein
MVVCAGLVVRSGSDIFTPQELAHRLVALDYGNGTAYAGLQMLEGATPREAITGIQLKEPGHIPEAEARWAWEWMVSWGVLEGSFDPRTQINKAIETRRMPAQRRRDVTVTPPLPRRSLSRRRGRWRTRQPECRDSSSSVCLYT